MSVGSTKGDMSAVPMNEKPKRVRVGVLAVQGDFAEHAARLRDLGCETIELRSAADLDTGLDAIVLPGGESSVQTALLEEFAMTEPLKQLIAEGVPVLATCAGLILLANEVEHTNGGTDASAPLKQACIAPGAIGTLPVRVKRNAYGRQLASFHAEAPLHGSAPFESCATTSSSSLPTADTESLAVDAPLIPLTFIRAPQIAATGKEVETLVSVDGAPVAVRFGNQVGITFHPELDDDDTLYQFFLSLIAKRNQQR